jgi:hypothetical protein
MSNEVIILIFVMDFSMEPKSESAIPVTIKRNTFHEALKDITFVSSIGFGLALVASVTLVPSASFLGRNDSSSMALLANTATFYTWSASSYGVGLMLAITGLLVMTYPNSEERLLAAHQYAWLKIYIIILYNLSFVFALVGTVLIAEGLKSVATGAGWLLEIALAVVVASGYLFVFLMDPRGIIDMLLCGSTWWGCSEDTWCRYIKKPQCGGSSNKVANEELKKCAVSLELHCKGICLVKDHSGDMYGIDADGIKNEKVTLRVQRCLFE